MAGGKETPRQKMIGMMYLVLTALLALQVSNAVLEKFAIIQETLSELVSAQRNNNDAAVQGIVDVASKSPNPAIKKAGDDAKKVQDLTKTTLDYMDGLKVKMMKLSGTDKIDEKLINDHGSKVATMMIDPRAATGKEFETKMNEFVTKLGEITGTKYDKIAKAPKEIPVFAADPDHSRKSFLEFTFENTPVIAALTSVTQMETQVLDHESKALEELSAKVGAKTLKADIYIPMVKANSNTVAAGADYVGQLYLVATSSSVEPEFSMNGAKLEVVTDEHNIKAGKIKFKASGGTYDPKTNTIKKSFTTTIKFNDTTITQNIEYFVAKPVVDFASAALSSLWLNCGNEVAVSSPAFGAEFNPSLSSPAGQAEYIKGNQPGKFVIVPTSRKVAVTVTNAGIVLDTKTFDTKVPPPPVLEFKDGQGREIDAKRGLAAGALTNVRVEAIADENFQREAPRDARYRVKKVVVNMYSGGVSSGSKTFTNGNLDLGYLRGSARKGNILSIEVSELVRIPFRGSEEQVKLRTNYLQVQIL